MLFDAGNTLLEIDYPLLTAQLVARGHAVNEARVVDAEQRGRIRLDHEQAAQPTRERKGAGRYLRYLQPSGRPVPPRPGPGRGGPDATARGGHQHGA